eukprot:6205124-Prymnesium_polylepis.1
MRSALRGPRSATVRMFALEAAPVNAEILRRVVAATHIPATVHAVGASDGETALFADPRTPPGYETSSVSSARGVRINTTTLDRRARAQEATPRASSGTTAGAEAIERAHLVTIDTEGWDGRVLAGMRATLTARRVDLLEFEYSVKWGVHGERFSLQTTLDWLLRAGYSCFWQGWPFGGLLAPASGACWQPEFARFHPMSWGNLICSHRAELLEMLQRRSLGPERGPP